LEEGLEGDLASDGDGLVETGEAIPPIEGPCVALVIFAVLEGEVFVIFGVGFKGGLQQGVALWSS